MKRLIKKSKIYTGIKYEGEYVEVYINPTDEEIQRTMSNGRYHSIRGIIDGSGQMIIWPGRILHADIGYRNDGAVDISQFRFAYDPTDKEWLTDAHEKYTVEETLQLYQQYQSQLSRIGNINDVICIWYAKDKRDYPESVVKTTMNEIPAKKQVAASLKKKASYIHCHECGWSQDDYWNESYNPIRFMLNWEEALLNEDIDKPFTEDPNFIKENGDLTLREVIAQEMERAANHIRDMKYRNHDECEKKNPDRKCPKCGHGLDED